MSKDNKSDKSTLPAFWPTISDEKGARGSALIGVAGAGLVAAITATASLYSAYSSPVLGLSIWSLLYAFLFVVIAFGIWKMSRAAAVSGLCLFLVEQWYMLTMVGKTANGAMIALFVVFFIVGIRGTFAYHRIRGTKQIAVEEEE